MFSKILSFRNFWQIFVCGRYMTYDTSKIYGDFKHRKIIHRMSFSNQVQAIQISWRASSLKWRYPSYGLQMFECPQKESLIQVRGEFSNLTESFEFCEEWYRFKKRTGTSLPNPIIRHNGPISPVTLLKK